MGLAIYLKKLVSAIVDDYTVLFGRTIGIAITATLTCFTVILIFVRYSIPSSHTGVSILSYFFFRYSKDGVYALVDLSKTMYLFFVAFTSLGLMRLSSDKSDDKDYYSFGAIISKVGWRDTFILVFATLIASAIDYGMVWVDGIVSAGRMDYNLKHYIVSNLFFIRVYSPLFLFAITIYSLYANGVTRLRFSRVVMLLISLWLFNEFVYESFLLVRNQLFNLILLPFGAEKIYMVESVLGVFLMSAYFIGFHAAMTVPFIIFKEEDNTLVGKS